MAGVAGGLVLAPENFAPEDAGSIAFIPSFGIGVLIFIPFVTAFPFVLRREMPNFLYKETSGLGALAGLLWNASNIAAIFAIGSIGYSVAYPMLQCGLFVAGLWGIFLFGEIQGPAQRIYWISGICLMAGACLLAYAK